MLLRNHIAVGLFLLSLTLLIPGLVYPMITIKASVQKSEIIDLGVRSLVGEEDSPSLTGRLIRSVVRQLHIDGSVDIYDKTRSVLSTIQNLMTSGYPVVAFLIGLFAVVVPITKSLLMIGAALSGGTARTHRLQRAGQLISKWSMVDVFVIAIIVSYLVFNASGASGGTMKMNAQFGIGFYFFTAYCVLSNLSAQLMSSSLNR